MSDYAAVYDGGNIKDFLRCYSGQFAHSHLLMTNVEDSACKKQKLCAEYLKTDVMLKYVRTDDNQSTSALTPYQSISDDSHKLKQCDNLFRVKLFNEKYRLRTFKLQDHLISDIDLLVSEGFFFSGLSLSPSGDNTICVHLNCIFCPFAASVNEKECENQDQVKAVIQTIIVMH